MGYGETARPRTTGTPDPRIPGALRGQPRRAAARWAGLQAPGQMHAGRHAADDGRLRADRDHRHSTGDLYVDGLHARVPAHPYRWTELPGQDRAELCGLLDWQMARYQPRWQIRHVGSGDPRLQGAAHL